MKDLYDGDDEIVVPELEPECEFRCDGMCHPAEWRCDGFFDCQDGLGKPFLMIRAIFVVGRYQ